jgi:hypothetical protein
MVMLEHGFWELAEYGFIGWCGRCVHPVNRRWCGGVGDGFGPVR